MNFVKTTVDRYDPGTQRSVPAGYVGRLTGLGTSRLAVDCTQYPPHWWEPATRAEYLAWLANPDRVHPAAPIGAS